MLRNKGGITRYLGGAKVFYTDKEGTEREIGEVQSAKLDVSSTTTEAFSKDSSMKKQTDQAVTEINATIEFTTNNINIENMAMSMLGTVENETFALGDTLPDGSVAAEETTLQVIRGAKNPLIEGSFRFVGDEDGDTKPVLIIHNASITPNGGHEYITDQFATLGFSGKVMETDKGYFDEFRMPVGS